MISTALHHPTRAPSAPASRTDLVPDATPSPPTSAASPPGFGEMVAETMPLVGSVAYFGPPVIFVAGPWALLVLMLTGPFALLVTLVVATLVATALLVGLAAVLVALPYLLVRRYGVRRAAAHAPARAAAHGAPATGAAFAVVRRRQESGMIHAGTVSKN